VRDDHDLLSFDRRVFSLIATIASDLLVVINRFSKEKIRAFRLVIAFEHDPEKACPGLDPGVGTGFRTRSCSNKKLEPDSDST
jgi:hypothetical protein